MLSVHPKQTVSMLTRHGVRLDADVYYPNAEGTFPVLLMRQPYGRAIASTVVYAHPSWYAAHGYIVVIQDVRGRGTSEGDFSLFAHEVEDGADTVHWAANLPGSNGRVGMYGFSYQGMTQLYAAVERPEPLKTIAPAMVGYDLYQDWAYEGGAFCLQPNLLWAIQLATETARRHQDEAAYQALLSLFRNPPLYERVPANPARFQELAPDSFYQDWLHHSEPDDYWDQLSPSHLLQAVDLPMLHIGGWFDTFIRGTIRLYKAMAERSQFPQHLMVGPWVHLPWGRKVGALDYGSQSASPVDRRQLRWFDYWLKGIDTGMLQEPSIYLFEMGSNCWKSFSQWPQPATTSYFLSSTGLACIDDYEGRLTPDLPAFICPADTFVHDPWRPVPALGGHAAYPSGPYDRSSLESRTDIVKYTSTELSQPLSLAGDVSVQLWIQADAVSFDVCAILSEVHPNGAVYPLTQGYVRVKPGQETAPLLIPLQPTCVQIAKGNALRLSVSAACFPAFPVNPGTGATPGETRLMDCQVITLTIATGGNCPSQVLLPITEAATS